ncbi:hypothetical protein M9434_004266 [Picochlorum sp. BPE23]|nr:hypothetical protein M9434_004266 [Picochlorum sp. BPE23]KAI8113853.1 hypothetical protein M9435_003844 [Picochlorum sp. BPE23]
MRPGRSYSKGLTAGALVIFVGLVASYPVLHATKGPKISEGTKGLNPDAQIRGAYTNTGSKDIGPDTRVYKS